MTELENFIKKNQEKLVKIHWDDIINKQVENISLSKILLQELGEEEYFIPLQDFFKSINKNMNGYLESAMNPSYQIAIVGAIKAGKSTLINALIGHELASVNVTPETATLTKFKYSEKNALKVKFYSSKEWDEIWFDAKEKKAEIFLEEYKMLGANQVKHELLDKEELYLEFSSCEEMKKEITRWTSSKEKEHYFVKELEIGLQDLNLPSQICLVDTPGLNDIIDYRSKITRNYIDSANAVIICVNAKTLRNEEMLTIARVFSKARYKKNKIYVLGTQIDTMNSNQDWLLQRNDWIKTLRKREYFESREMADKHLIGISAFAYAKAISLKNKSKINDDDILSLYQMKLLSRRETKSMMRSNAEKSLTEKEIQNLVERIVSYSQIEHIKKIIQKELLENFNSSLVQDYVEKYKILKEEIESFGATHQEILENKKKELEMTSDELERKIEQEKAKIKKVEEFTEKLEEKMKETTQNFNVDFRLLSENFKKLEEGIKKINIE